MARFPIIDTPCPLGKDEQALIAGHDCGHCGKTVHALDGMDDAGRLAFMRDAKGPVCVSYRLPVGLGAAMALSMAAPAFAQDAPHPTASIRQATAAPDAKAPSSPIPRPSAVVEPPRQRVEVFAGGVHEPSATRWTEDLSLPELPTVPDDTVVR